MHDRQSQLFSTSVSFLVISTVVISARLLARLRIRGIRADDWCMIGAQSLFFASCITTSLAAVAGFGLKDDELLNECGGDEEYYQYRTRVAYKWMVIFRLIITVAFAFARCSVCLSIYRITTSKYIRWYLCFLMFITNVCALGTFIYLCTLCKRLSDNWAEWDPIPPGCKADTTAAFHGITYFGTAVAIVVDFSIPALSGYVIRNVQMSRRTRLLLMTLLGVSAVGCFSSIARLPFLYTYDLDADGLWVVVPAEILNYSEVFLIVTLGSIPPLKSLFNGRSRTSTLPSNARSFLREVTVRKTDQSRAEHTVQGNDTVISQMDHYDDRITTTIQPSPPMEEYESASKDMKDGVDIYKVTSVNVEVSRKL